MNQRNGTGTLFIIALAIIGIILYVAARTYNIDYLDNIDYVFFGFGMTMLSTAKKMGLIDDQTEERENRILKVFKENVLPPFVALIALLERTNTTSRAIFFKWLGYWPGKDIYTGDERSEYHIGNMSKNLDFIVYTHMIEFGAIDNLPLTQSIALYTYLFDELLIKSNRTLMTKGSHLGIAANIDLQIPVREYHCKYVHELRFVTVVDTLFPRGSVLLSDMENNILIYPNGRIFIMDHNKVITEVNN